MAVLQSINLDDTGFLKLPIGTTAQRPTPETGMGRYNSDTNSQEWYDGNDWTQLIPAGAVRAFSINTAPVGWLKCNGAAVSRTTYSKLFSTIGTSWGAGNGSTTFNLPDLRGEFIRFFSDGSSVDSGRSFASFQAQDWKGFWQTNTGQNTFAYDHGPVYMGKTFHSTYTGNMFSGGWLAPAAAIGTAWDGSEIRPRNRSLLYCIKY